MTRLNEILTNYTKTSNKYCAYDYIANDGSHYLELKQRRCDSTKYNDIAIDEAKMKQLLNLDKPTLLLSTYTDGKLYSGWLTNKKEDGVMLNPKIKTISKKAPKNTDFGSRYNYINKTLYILDILDAKDVS